jgi:GNAT superfamily N-acetyltransferase
MTEPLILRRAALSDVSAVRELSKAAYAKWVPLIGRDPMPMTANYERAVMEHVIDLYEEGGELLALIEMIPDRNHLLIENIAVRPDRQGKGLGDRLLRHAEGVALILGFAEVRLYTNAAFLSNLAFYRKRGYLEYRRGTMVPGSTTVFMRKGLRGTPLVGVGN